MHPPILFLVLIPTLTFLAFFFFFDGTVNDTASVEISVLFFKKSANKSAAFHRCTRYTTPVHIPKPFESCWSDTCVSMFVATLFTIAKKCSHSTCPSAEMSKMKLWDMHTMEFYWGVKNYEICRKINGAGKIPSEVAQSQKLQMQPILSNADPSFTYCA